MESRKNNSFEEILIRQNSEKDLKTREREKEREAERDYIFRFEVRIIFYNLLQPPYAIKHKN